MSFQATITYFTFPFQAVYEKSMNLKVFLLVLFLSPKNNYILLGLETAHSCKNIRAKGSVGDKAICNQNYFFWCSEEGSWDEVILLAFILLNILAAKSKALRKESRPLLLNHPKHHGGAIHIFVNEKKFLVDELNSCRNSRVIPKVSSYIPPDAEQTPSIC